MSLLRVPRTALLFAAAMPAAALADDPPSHTAPDVIVSAEGERSLTVPTMEEARRRLDTTPGGVDLVDPETYKIGRAASVFDALGFATGVFVQPRFGADESRISIRGSGIQRTFHLRGIQFLQDGIPLNLADGSGDFQAIDPLAVSYIEVWRGANALVYGSTTLGGAINYVTPTGFVAAPLQARAAVGSFGFAHGQLSAGLVEGKSDFYGSVTELYQDGYRDHSRQNNGRGFFNYGYRVRDDIETRFDLSIVNSDSQLPGSISKRELEQDPRKANPVNVLLDQKRDFNLARVANKTVWLIDGESQLQVSTFYSWKDLYHPIFQVLDIESQDFGADIRYTNQSNLWGLGNLFLLGFSPVQGLADDNRFVNVNGKPGARTNEYRQTATNLNLYGEDQLMVLPRTWFVLGAQLVEARRKLEDRFITASGDESFDVTYRGFSPKVGARYDAMPGVQVFGNVSRSFEPPSFGELAGGPGITQVQPQTATTFEIGTRGNMPNVKWDLAIYRSHVYDELLGVNGPNGIFLGTTNVPNTIHQGVEAGLDLILAERFLLRQVYLYNDFRFDDNLVYGNNELPGIPRQYYRAELLYQTPSGYYVGPDFTWSPEKYPVDMANTLFADPYFLIGFKAGFRTPSGWSWFVDARNLTNEKFAASTGVIADARGLDSRQFLPGDGRAFYVGLEWRM